MKKILSLIAAIMLLAPLSATNYTATNASTFLSLLSQLTQGDTLFLRDGTYTFSDKVSVNKQGTATRPVVITGYPGEKAILDFHQVPYGTRGLTIHANALYVHVKNLTIAWSGKNNLYCEGSYCLFENLDIYGSADTGCQMKKGGNNVIKNVDSHDNFDYEANGQNADGFADKQFNGPGNHYIGCRAWNNSDDGWDFYQRVSYSQTIIENCICYKNGPAYYDLSSNPRVTGVDKNYFNGKDISHFPNGGNGNGFKLGGASTKHDALVHHCLSVANTVKGFDQNSDAGTLYLYNNTAYLNGNAESGSDYGFYNENGCALYIHNCISFHSVNPNMFMPGIVRQSTNNTWNNGFSVSASDFQSLDTTFILAPRQADGALPENAFMRLTTNSTLIDAGVDVNLGYNGAAPDLGCYEAVGERHDPEPEPEPEPKPEGAHKIAYVTVPNSYQDNALLTYLNRNDSLDIVIIDAAETDIDYSPYEAIIISSTPASSLAGLADLKTSAKPIVLLKPWLLKPGVWSWGTAINTADLSIAVSDPTHPLFQGITISDGEIPLFTQCNTNAVTAISEWTYEGTVNTLATPVSNANASSVAILSNGLIMIGVSEYSTAYLTSEAKRLIENAILLQLGITMPTGIENTEYRILNTDKKFIQDGQLYLQMGDALYDVTGRRVR